MIRIREIYLPPECYARDYSLDMVPYAPDITTTQLAATLSVTSPKSVLAHTPSQIAMAKELGIPVFASMRMNVWNTPCAEAVCAMGADTVTITPEIPLGAVRAIRASKAVIAYGRLPLMVTENCLFKNRTGECACRQGSAKLVDKTGAEFPVIKDGASCRSVLLNGKKLYWLDRQDDLGRLGLWATRLYFTTENPKEVDQVLSFCNNPVPFDPGASTRGLYLRGLD